MRLWWVWFQKPKISVPSAQTATSMSSVSDEDAWQTVGGNSKKSDKQAKGGEFFKFTNDFPVLSLSFFQKLQKKQPKNMQWE